MPTCSQCNTQSPDAASYCVQCGADLRESATTAVALKRFQTNPRVKYVRIVVTHDACPACMVLEGAYDKGAAPPLPVEACTHANGCRCFYLPFLNDIYP